MPDGLRNHEIAQALEDNARAMRALESAVHEWCDALRGLERQVADNRGAVETLPAVHQTLVDLRRDELALERDKVEREITGEVARVEAERRPEPTRSRRSATARASSDSSSRRAPAPRSSSCAG
jgi:hypothetical protein